MARNFALAGLGVRGVSAIEDGGANSTSTYADHQMITGSTRLEIVERTHFQELAPNDAHNCAFSCFKDADCYSFAYSSSLVSLICNACNRKFMSVSRLVFRRSVNSTLSECLRQLSLRIALGTSMIACDST